MCPFVSSFQSLPDMPMYTHVLVTSHKEMGMAAVSCSFTLCAGLQCCWLARLLWDTCPVASCGSHISRHHTRSQYMDDPQRPAEASSPPWPWVPTLLVHQTMLDDTGPLTDRLLLSPLVVEKCFFFFFRFKNQFEPEPFFFLFCSFFFM